MRDPLSLLSLAVAAGGGTMDGLPGSALVAAGITLLQRSVPLVRALSGRRAAIMLPPSPQFLVALAASEGRGAVLVNPLAAPPEIAHQLSDANVGAVFTIEALAGAIPEGLVTVLLDQAPRTARVIQSGTCREVDLGSHFGLDLEGEQGVRGSDEEAVVVYTSAMAGTPLGAILTHRNLLANARSTIEAAEMTDADHMLALLPLSHLFGLTVTAIAPLLAGGRVSTVARFNPARTLEQLEQGDITQLVGVPAIFAALVALLERRGGKASLPNLRLAICGGAPLDVALQDRWANATGTELRQGYGLSEASPVCLFNRVQAENRRGSLGVPFPGVQATIRNPDSGHEVPDGVEGEICVRGENVFPGYVSNGEQGLGRHGEWLRTGDLGVRGEGGSIAFSGVLKPMFTRNGFNVYPRELERAMLELRGVESVRVRPVADAMHENEILLEVTGSVSENEVRDWAAKRLSAYKQPSEVRVVPV